MKTLKLIGLVCVALLSSTGARGRNETAQNLCDVLGNIAAGDEVDVTLSGRYMEGPETNVLYSTGCSGRFQPSTWVEFGAPTDDVERLRGVLAEFGQADVIFRGTLYGPRQVAKSGTTPNAVAEAAQMSGRRYGHLNAFRTMLVVREIVCVKGITATTGPQVFESDEVLRLVRAEMPLYPTVARAADVSGEVELEIDVKNGIVESIRTVSGHLLLARAARENVRTWQFVKGSSRKVRVVFDYRLVDGDNAVARAPRVELNLPAHVTITELRSMW